MDEIVGLSPMSSIGKASTLEEFRVMLDHRPDFIGLDAGTTDVGPYYFATGSAFMPEMTYKQDFDVLLQGAVERRIPFIVGSVFTSGCNSLLESGVRIVREVARERGLSFRLAVINAELDKDYLKERIRREGPLQSLGPRQELTPEVIDRSGPICAQMGVEPIIRALEGGADVVLCGRACDDAIFAAMPIMRGFDPGLALHMGKIMECAGASALPNSNKEPLLGRLRADHFTVRPLNEGYRCTTVSVAAHTLYETGDPCIHHGPGGINDLSDTSFTQADHHTVRVAGSRFVRDPVYKVKLEGGEITGYRSVVIVGVRDPVMIRELDALLAEVRQQAAKRFRAQGPDAYDLDFSVYGRDAVMREREPLKGQVGHEIGLLINVVASSQELASAVAMFVRGHLQHVSYPGIVTTSGNLAYPYSPFCLPAGPACRFSAYHLLPLADPCEIFPVTFHDIRN